MREIREIKFRAWNGKSRIYENPNIGGKMIETKEVKEFKNAIYCKAMTKDFIEAQKQINILTEISQQVNKQNFTHPQVKEFLLNHLLNGIDIQVEKRKKALDELKANL